MFSLQNTIRTESSETSLCRIPTTLLETRGQIRRACTPPWPVHPCHGNSPQAQIECRRHRRAWISSRSQTRVLQGKMPTPRGEARDLRLPPSHQGSQISVGCPCVILKLGFPPTRCNPRPKESHEALGGHFQKHDQPDSTQLILQRGLILETSEGGPLQPRDSVTPRPVCSVAWLRNNGALVDVRACSCVNTAAQRATRSTEDKSRIL